MAKKKAKKKRPADQSIDPNERRRERLEARRQAKAEAVAAQQKAARRERIVRWISIAGFAVLAFWFLFIRGQAPDAIAGEGGRQYPVDHFSTSAGRPAHISGTVSYAMSPPVSGQHSQNAAPCGVFGQPLPNENMVHILEHGAVGLLYKPDLEMETIEKVEELTRSYDSHTFSMPFEGLEQPITLVAWASSMKLEALDETAAKNFIDAFRQGGDAPEAFQDCPNDEDTPFTNVTPTPVPLPTATEVSPSPTEAKKKK